MKVVDLQARVSQVRAAGAGAADAHGAAHATRMLKRIAKVLEEREDLAIDLNAAGIDSQEVQGFVAALQALESQVEPLREKLSALKKARKPAAAEP